MNTVLINRPIKSIKRIDDVGDEYWEIPNGECHREDGPAVTDTNGTQQWMIRGIRHRTDGPAIIWGDGEIEWFLNGFSYFFNEFCDKLKKNYGKTDEDIMLLRMQYPND